MRVRLRLDPRNNWVVESKYWYQFKWQCESVFYFHSASEKSTAYELAKEYAQALLHPEIEEIA
jgi:hypothetical protein